MVTKIDLDIASTKQIENELGRLIKELRISKNLTQDDLANAAGINRKTLYRFKNGDSVSLETFLRILDVLDLTKALFSIFPNTTIQPIHRFTLKSPKLRVSKDNLSLKGQFEWSETKKNLK